MNKPTAAKIAITLAAAAIGAAINLFPVSLFFGAHFLLGGIVAQVPTVLFGPLWGAFAAGVAVVPTLWYWQDPFYPFMVALATAGMGLWLRRRRSWVLEGLLLVGFVFLAPTGLFVYGHYMGLPWPQAVVITAKVILNLVADVMICSNLLYFSGIEQRWRRDPAAAAWDMRAHLVGTLSLVMVISLGVASVFFGRAEYRNVQAQAAADAKVLTARVQHDLARWLTDRLDLMAALAPAVAHGREAEEIEQSLAFVAAAIPDAVRVELLTAPEPATAPGARISPVFAAAGPGEPARVRISLPLGAPVGAAGRHLTALYTLELNDFDHEAAAAGVVIVLDQQQRLVLGPPAWSAGAIWDESDLGVRHAPFLDTVPLLPDSREDTLVQWRKGWLMHAVTEPVSGWQVVGLLPLSHYQDRLFFAYEIILGAGLLLLVAIAGTSHLLSRRLTRPLERLAAVARLKLLQSDGDQWPEVGNIAEVNLLVTHLRGLEDSLAAAYRQQKEQNRALTAANQSLYWLATTDALTGLSNRVLLDNSLERELARACRRGCEGALLMIDLDNFKTVNDVYGHQAGDDALRAVAATIRSCIRATDVAGRYGGEELAVVLVDTDRPGAMQTAERIRQAIAARAITTAAGETFHVTASLGVAVFPGDGDSLPAIVRAADAALYAAKLAGKNCVRGVSR